MALAIQEAGLVAPLKSRRAGGSQKSQKDSASDSTHACKAARC